MTKSMVYPVALGLAGVLYLVLALFLQIDSPLFAFALITLSGYELVRNHRRKYKP
ncbi:MAG: hypothetical protein LAQ69_20315 [Acidobacteriia bacterium]|nr:hypothetical protein [Terriglobia bacterium]